MDKKIILVLASADDGSMDVLRANAANGEVELKFLTPRDLSRQGWFYRHGAIEQSTCIAGSEVMPADTITGVITRMAAVYPRDLPHIVESDREYLAAEMTAFLLAWLTSLECPMLNRPTPTCLAGPHLRREALVNRVAGLGIPVIPCKTHLACGSASPEERFPMTSRVVITGERHLGRVHPLLVEYAREIARALGAEFIAIDFSGTDEDASFVGTDLWPAIDAPLARLMLDWLSASRADASVAGEAKCA